MNNIILYCVLGFFLLFSIWSTLVIRHRWGRKKQLVAGVAQWQSPCLPSTLSWVRIPSPALFNKPPRQLSWQSRCLKSIVSGVRFSLLALQENNMVAAVITFLFIAISICVSTFVIAKFLEEDKFQQYSQIAQSVEQVTVNHRVGGSSPSLGAFNFGE